MRAAAKTDTDILPLYYGQYHHNAYLLYDRELQDVFDTALGAIYLGMESENFFYAQIRKYLQFSEDDIRLMMEAPAFQDHARAVGAHHIGLYDEAEEYYRKTLEYLRENPTERLSIIQVYLEFGQFYIDMASQYTGTDNNTKAKAYREKAYEQLDNLFSLPRAEKSTEKGAKLLIEAYKKRSQLRTEDKEWDRAIADLSKALKLSKEQSEGSESSKNQLEIYILRGIALYHAAQYENAWNDLQALPDGDNKTANDIGKNLLGHGYLYRARCGRVLDKGIDKIRVDSKSAMKHISEYTPLDYQEITKNPKDLSTKNESSQISIIGLIRQEFGKEVFISYSHHDKGFVTKLVDDLRQKLTQSHIWWDQNIPAGSDWEEEIDKALERSDAMILILSPLSMESSNVTLEWRYYSRESKDIIPVILKPCKIPLRLQSVQ